MRPKTEMKTTDVRATTDQDAKARKYIPLDTPWARLSHPNLPGYFCYWFNDVPGRLHRAKQAGYVHVSRQEVPFFGDRDNDPSQKEGLGDYVSTVVGQYDNGTPIYAYLMKIPQQIYDNQQQGREARELAKLKSTKREGQKENVPGNDELYPVNGGIYIE